MRAARPGRGRRGEGGARAAASPQKLRAAQEDGASAAIPAELVRGPWARAGGSGRATTGTDVAPGRWRDQAIGAPRDPRLWKLCAGAPTCSRRFSHPLGSGERRGPGFSAVPPPQRPARISLALGAHPLLLPLCGGLLALDTGPPAPSRASSSAPFPSRPLCSPAPPWPPYLRGRHPPAPSHSGRRRLFASSKGFWCIDRNNLTFSNAKYST